MKLRAPCELIIWYLLPGIRSQLAKELVELGFSQQEVGRRLGITQAAVSQYVSDKRGKSKGFEPEIMEMIKGLAEDIASDKVDNLIPEICEICVKAKEDRMLCRLHGEHERVPEDCDICLPREG